MTHAEMTANDRQGYRSACPGLLKTLGSYPDGHFDPVTRETVRRLVTVWGCECGHDLSIAEEGTVLNVYERPGRGPAAAATPPPEQPSLFPGAEPKPDRPGAYGPRDN